MASLRIKRGTRAQLDAAAGSGTLKGGEPYLITDENRFAVGVSTVAYQASAKQGEATPPNRAVIALGSVSGATPVNVSSGECHTLSVAAGATATLTFSGWGPNATVSDQMLVISVGAGSTINWPAGYKFVGADGTIYTTFAAAQTPLSTSQVNHVVLWTIDGGTTVYVRAG